MHAVNARTTVKGNQPENLEKRCVMKTEKKSKEKKRKEKALEENTVIPR